MKRPKSSYSHKLKYSGMAASDVKKLKALEAENAKLKKLLAETVRDVARCQFKKVATPDAKRGVVAHLSDRYQVSLQQACEALRVDRSTLRYLSIKR